MKQQILNHLREFPGSTTNGVVKALGLKRGSVSKCLTRLMFANEIRGRLENGRWRYSAVATPPSPANSEVPATTNA